MKTTTGVMGLAAAYARAIDGAVVVVEIENGGTSRNVELAFPSLGPDDLDILEAGPLILAFDDVPEAQHTFNAFTKEAFAGYQATASIVTSIVHYVGPIQGNARITTSNSADARGWKNVHLFVEGRLTVSEER